MLLVERLIRILMTIVINQMKKRLTNKYRYRNAFLILI